MKTLLSTKKLTFSQKELLVSSEISLVEYNAILIEFIPFNIPNKIKKAIFTSQNAVHSFIQNKALKPQIDEVFCVGEKTKELLVKNGQNVVKNEKNVSILANFIKKTYENELFYFFCGNLKNATLRSSLESSKNEVFEVKTYQNTAKWMHFSQFFDGILFFSPSGVSSFASENSIDSAIAFCIGETTASEAKKYTNNIVIANSATVESVIAKAVKILK